MATIILVRHGENDWVNKHRLAGWIEGVHLNENGRKQAQDAAERLKEVKLAALYSSPVIRCVETAEYISKVHNLPIQELPEVGEVRYGEWEGKKIKNLAKLKIWSVVQFFPSRMRFPKGEALREVQFRAVQALEKLSKQHKDETIVICSHADLIKLVLAHYLGVHMDLFQRIVISPASASVIALPDNGMVRVLRLNDTGPIKTPPKSNNKKEKNKKKGSKKSKDRKQKQK